MNYHINVGENIKKLRELKGLSREYVAEKLDLHLTSYGNIERGQSDITVNKLFRIAEVLQVNPSDIIVFTDKYDTGNINNIDQYSGNASVTTQVAMAISNLNRLLTKLIEKINK